MRRADAPGLVEREERVAAQAPVVRGPGLDGLLAVARATPDIMGRLAADNREGCEQLVKRWPALVYAEAQQGIGQHFVGDHRRHRSAIRPEGAWSFRSAAATTATPAP